MQELQKNTDVALRHSKNARQKPYEQDCELCQRAWVEINQECLHHNVHQLTKLLAPPTQLLAVVKADAYGHGAQTVAKTVLDAGAVGLCVATVQEGIQLRKAGIPAPVLLFGATNTSEQVRAIAHWQLQPTLCNPQQALVFSEALADSNITLPIHLKLDTGMSRLGMPWQEATQFARIVQQLPHLKIASVYSHLATAENLDSTVTQQQHQRFEKAVAQLHAAGIEPPSLHLANSAGTLTDPALHYDFVRVGLALYGLYPAPHLQRVIKLKPVMQVKARVMQVKTIAPGTGVSYGYTFIAQQQMRLAVVGIGYADGVPRRLSNQMTALIRGQRVRQIGAITMDQLMLDVSEIPDVQTGEVVTLIGQDGEMQISVDDWADILKTISWEIICGFKHRLPRLVLN
ncbi:MAG: alanine racemase [Symploca sp. SIO3C6]|nr:alanine racemase [Symploca sp. SIO3C6]